jgi:hypothetical protein
MTLSQILQKRANLALHSHRSQTQQVMQPGIKKDLIHPLNEEPLQEEDVEERPKESSHDEVSAIKTNDVTTAK